MWVEETKGERINNARCGQAQACASKTGSKIVAMNCPFCIQMFEDGIPSVESDEDKRMKSMDIAELLEQAVFGSKNGAAPAPAAEATAQPAAAE